MVDGGIWARRAVKSALANVLHHTGLRRAFATVRRVRSGGRRVLIVGYHRVVEDFTGEAQRSIPGTLISVETLRRHLEEAHAAGFEPTSLDDALALLSGTRRGRRDALVVTFDDGYRDVYQHAFPLLKRMGIPATVYLSSGYVGTQRRFLHDRLHHLLRKVTEPRRAPLYDVLPPSAAVLIEPVRTQLKTPSAALDDFLAEHPRAELEVLAEALERYLGGGDSLVPPVGEVMTWDEARALAKAGITLGAHTVEHTVLPLVDDAELEREVAESKAHIERELGRPVHHFAYCNGWYSNRVIRTLVRHGFRSAVTTEDAHNPLGGDPFTLRRKVLWENFSLGLDGRYSKPLTACQLDDVFGMLGMRAPVLGRREDTRREEGPEPLPAHGEGLVRGRR